MKMVIVQSEKKMAIALRDDGTFVRIPQRGYQVGQTLTAMPAPKSIIRFSRAAVAAAIIILFGGSSAFAARMPYSYVIMDVNPSVKYTLNIFDHVLSVDAVNDDAQPIVEALNQENISYCKLDDAIDMTIEQCQQKGYLYKDDKDYVVLSVMSVSEGKTDTLATNLEQLTFGGGLIAAEIIPSTIEEMEKDEQQGTTPGKLEIINQMQKRIGDDKPSEEWIDTPIRQIMEASETEDIVQTQQSNLQTTYETQNDAVNQRIQDMKQIENYDMQNVPASSNSSVSYRTETESMQQPAKDTSDQSSFQNAKEETHASPPNSDEISPIVAPQQVSSPESNNPDVFQPSTEQPATEKENGDMLQFPTEQPVTEKENGDVPQSPTEQSSIQTEDTTVPQTAADPPISQSENVAPQQTITEMPSSDISFGSKESSEQQSHEIPDRQPSSSFGR